MSAIATACRLLGRPMSTMSAVVASSKRCVVESRPIPVPVSGELLLKVHAAGLNRPDVMQRSGTYPPPPGASDILGLEVCGEIISIGGDVVVNNSSKHELGDRVCALVTGGAYAEYCLVDAEVCLKVPSHVESLQAACLPETTYTVWQNLFSCLPDAGSVNLAAGETLLVHGGTSGIGSIATQLAKARGCKVIATAGTEDKVRQCVEVFGADVAFNYNSTSNQSHWSQQVKDFILSDTNGGDGVDVVLDMVGGEYLQHNVNVLGTKGRLRVVGFMGGTPISTKVNMLRVLLKQISISGSVLRSRPIELKRGLTKEIEKHVLPLVQAGVVAPHLYRAFDLSTEGSVNNAMDLMETSTHVGKIVFKL